jgi:uncharacterized protein (TIGR03083 family)
MALSQLPATVRDMDYLAHLRSDSERFAHELAACDPTARVPSCPDWTAADLLWHLGEVQLFWGTIVAERLDDPAAADAAKPARPDGYDDLLDFYRRAGATLAEALDATPPDTAVWTWFEADQTAGFVRRRQAHEALIHRIDAELTTDHISDVDPALATDGVAEVLDWMYSGVPSWGTHTRTGPIGRVATTDTDGDWLVQLGTFSGTSPNTGTVYTDEATITLVDDGEPMFSVSGRARDLDAWLWNRPTLTGITLDGDYGRFVEIIRSGVQ